MRTLVKEVIAAEPMAQVVVLPWRTRCSPVENDVAVDQDFDSARVSGKVGSILVRCREFGRAYVQVVLGRVYPLMAEPALQFHQCHGLLCVIELRGDRRAGTMAGNPAASILARNTGLGAKQRDEGVVYVATRDLGSPVSKQEVSRFSVFRSTASG